MEKDLKHLPVLLRGNDPQIYRSRMEYPYSVHQYFNGFIKDEIEDPYENLIVWTKMAGHPAWPSRLASEEERSHLGPEKVSEFSQPQFLEDAESANDSLCMYFFGSKQVGLVKRSSIEPYLSKYKDYAEKCSQKSFLLGLEEADAEVMRQKFSDGIGNCMKCGGSENPTRIILCDRCNSEVHLSCLQPPLHDVPEDDWLCPLCEKEAPLTFETCRDSPTSKRRKKKGRPPVGKVGGQKRSEQIFWTEEEDRLLFEWIPKSSTWLDVSHHIPGRSEYGCKNRYVVLGRKRKHVINASHLKISEQTLRASGRFRKTSDNKPIPILPSTSTEVDINGNMPLALRRPKRITTTSQQINHNLSEEATTHQETDNHKYAPAHLSHAKNPLLVIDLVISI